MSSFRGSLIATSLSVVLVPAICTGQARAQCRGGQGSSQSSLQSQGRAALRGQTISQSTVLSAVRQANSLQTQFGAGFNLQATASLQLSGRLTAAQQQLALQTSLAQISNLLNAAQQQGGSLQLINRLTLLQQQIAALLANLQASASAQQLTGG
jgi:hypothetical protein